MKQCIKLKDIIFFVIPFAMLLITLLSFWPGIYTYDGDTQWQQVVSGNINNEHPFFSTYFMLILSKIWNYQTVILIYQILLFSIIWFLICIDLFKEKKRYKSILIYTILMCLTPIISIYAVTVWKDVIYSYYLLFISYFLYKGAKNNFNYKTSNLIIIGLLLGFIFSYRHNGIIVAILLMIFILITFVKKKISFKKSFLILITFIIFLGAVSIPKNYYLNKASEQSKKAESTTIIDNYMTWIMGRYILNNYISDEDLAFLNNYIEIDEWKKAYNAYLINNTNLAASKNNEFINDNIEEFHHIFIKYTLKHPETFVMHYLKADALLWNPFPIGYIYQYDFKLWGPEYGFLNDESSKISLLKKFHEKLTTITMRRPIRIIFYQPATIMYISLIALLILVKSTKNKKYWFVCIPMIANIISLLPINLAQDLRYVYINYLTLAYVGILITINFKYVSIYLKRKFSHLINKAKVFFSKSIFI